MIMDIEKSPTRRQNQNGAAMLIVMLVLLMTTAMATYAVQSTTSEIRAAGNARQFLGTQAAAETGLSMVIGWLDSAMGFSALQVAMARSHPTLAPFEPNVGPGKAFRVLLSDFSGLVGQPIPPPPTASSMPRNAYASTFTVDITDSFVCRTYGERADGLGAQDANKCLCSTFTSRGRSGIGVGTIGTPDYRASGDIRDYHEGASDAQAHGVTCRR